MSLPLGPEWENGLLSCSKQFSRVSVEFKQKHLSLELKLSPAQSLRQKESRECERAARLYRLFMHFTHREQASQNTKDTIQKLAEDPSQISPTVLNSDDYQKHLRRFLTYCKKTINQQLGQYRNIQIQESLTSTQLVFLENQLLQENKQILTKTRNINKLVERIHALKEEQQNRAQERVSAYNILLQNARLRLNQLGLCNTSQNLEEEGDQEEEELDEQTQEALQNLEIVNKIINNGAWGMLDSLKRQADLLASSES